jgi:hypothetical protein
LPGTVLATFAPRPDACAASNASNLESEKILLKIADEYEALVRELRQSCSKFLKSNLRRAAGGGSMRDPRTV